MHSPGFDIGNFISYVNQLCEPDGVYKKVFNTKYLIFEYTVQEAEKTVEISQFHYLSVYQLVGYSGIHPMTMQLKKKVWYNIRPDSAKKWYAPEKTPALFIAQLVKCIEQCPQLEEKEKGVKIATITQQFQNIHFNTPSTTGGITIFPNKSYLSTAGGNV